MKSYILVAGFIVGLLPVFAWADYPIISKGTYEMDAYPYPKTRSSLTCSLWANKMTLDTVVYLDDGTKIAKSAEKSFSFSADEVQKLTALAVDANKVKIYTGGDADKQDGYYLTQAYIGDPSSDQNVVLLKQVQLGLDSQGGFSPQLTFNTRKSSLQLIAVVDAFCDPELKNHFHVGEL